MKVVCILLLYIEFMYGVLLLREEGRITGLRRRVVCSEVAARKERARQNLSGGQSADRLHAHGKQLQYYQKATVVHAIYQ